MNSWRHTLLRPRVRRIQYDPTGSFDRLPDPGLADEAREALETVAAAEHASSTVDGTDIRALTSGDGSVLAAPLAWDVDDSGVTISYRLHPGERLYGAPSADAQSLNRRGSLVHLYNELHPVGRHNEVESTPCAACAEVAAADAASRAREAELVGHELPDSNYGEYALPFFWSSRGYAVYISNLTSRATLDLGYADASAWTFRADRGAADIYLIGPCTLAEAVAEYHWLTGHQAQPPHWALGYIQSKFGYESFQQAGDVAEEMAARGMPMHALVFDVQWLNHYVDLSWSERGFANPEAGLERLEEAGSRAIVITEPMVRSDSPNATGPDAADAWAVDSSGEPYNAQPWFCGSGIAGFPELEQTDGRLLNFFCDATGDWWTAQHSALRSAGVDAWWIDLNEPEGAGDDAHFPNADWPAAGDLDGRDVRNALALAQQRAFSRLDDREHVRRLLLSRSGAPGSQRYGTSPWTGDIGATWTDLARQPRLIMNLGLAGLPLSGCDLGGFFGEPTPELFTRFLQAGALMPVMRAHGALSDREPWSRGEDAAARVAAAIRLRGRLLPQIVSWAYEAIEQGRPLMRPMAFDFPDDDRFAETDDQWIFGDILAAPVLEPGATTRDVLIPAGAWQRLAVQPDGRLVPEGEPIQGPTTDTLDVDLDSLPLYAPAGALLVTDPEPLDRRAYNWPPPRLEVVPAGVAAGGNAHGTLLVDDGVTPAADNAGLVRCHLTMEADGVDTRVVAGDADRLPPISLAAAGVQR